MQRNLLKSVLPDTWGDEEENEEDVPFLCAPNEPARKMDIIDLKLPTEKTPQHLDYFRILVTQEEEKEEEEDEQTTTTLFVHRFAPLIPPFHTNIKD